MTDKQKARHLKQSRAKWRKIVAEIEKHVNGGRAPNCRHFYYHDCGFCHVFGRWHEFGRQQHYEFLGCDHSCPLRRRALCNGGGGTALETVGNYYCIPHYYCIPKFRSNYDPRVALAAAKKMLAAIEKYLKT